MQLPIHHSVASSIYANTVQVEQGLLLGTSEGAAIWVLSDEHVHNGQEQQVLQRRQIVFVPYAFRADILCCSDLKSACNQLSSLATTPVI